MQTVDIWRLHRRIVGPVLSESSIRPHFHKFIDVIQETMGILPTDKTFDFLNYARTCATNMFIRAALGDSLEPVIRQKYLQDFGR